MVETGKVIKTFTSKKGNEIVIRYPKWEDLDKALGYINNLSAEDTYIIFSGEKISQEEEMDYLCSVFKEMEKGNGSHLYAFLGDKLIATCGVSRREKRNAHIGRIGISVMRDYREEGVGTELMGLLCEEAKRLGFTMVDLKVYGTNDRAYHVYQKIGFVEAGRVPNAIRFKDGFVDEIWMYKTL